MLVFDLREEQEFRPERHLEKVLGKVEDGDVTVACWEPGHTSPNHCHPYATEIYYCVEGGGVMNVNGEQVQITPGSFIVHPPGELHEYVNGDKRSILFRVRYGDSMESRTKDWPTQPSWEPNDDDKAYFAD
jgi:quercetin dioxygenase-like cupin family protein